MEDADDSMKRYEKRGEERYTWYLSWRGCYARVSPGPWSLSTLFRDLPDGAASSLDLCQLPAIVELRRHVTSTLSCDDGTPLFGRRVRAVAAVLGHTINIRVAHEDEDR